MQSDNNNGDFIRQVEIENWYPHTQSKPKPETKAPFDLHLKVA